jgi:hypothetical protein
MLLAVIVGLFGLAGAGINNWDKSFSRPVATVTPTISPPVRRDAGISGFVA